jgi:hypothetical protein
MVSSKQDRAVQICAPRSTAHIGFRTPLAFRSLSKGGGGVRNRGRTSPTVQMSAPGSTAMKTIPDPPRLSTFKRRGGVRNRRCSFRRPRSSSPDQRLRHGPDLLSCPVFNPHGPASRHVIFLPAFPLPPCVTVHLSLTLPDGLSLVSSSIYHSPRILFPLCQPFTKLASSIHPLSLHISLMTHVNPPHLSHLSSSFVILLSSCHPFHALITRHHHSCHAPHPPRWPPCLSLKLFSCSRWQREKSSLSRDAELAGRSQSQEAVIEAVEGG